MDRALDSGQRVMEEYEAEKSADEPKDSPRARIAQNLKRQIDTVSERWSMLSHRSEDWQQWIDEVLRVSASVRLCFGVRVGIVCSTCLDAGAGGELKS